MLQALRRYRLEHGHAVVPLAIFAILANFAYLRRFGFYEDDWYYMAGAWGTPAAGWFTALLHSVRNFYVGRPLQEVCLYVFAYLGAVFESIGLLYAIAAILYALSVVLAYHVLKLRYSTLFASITAALFAVSPLTTIRQHLDGTLWSAPGFICLFLAILIYARARQFAWSYLFASMALLIYEPFFFVFLAAPVFRRGRKTWISLALHLATCGAILLVYLILRRLLSEARLSSSLNSPSLLATAWNAAAFALSWTAHSFITYAYAAIVARRDAATESVLWTLGLIAFVSITLFRSLSFGGTRRQTAGSIKRAVWWIRRAALPGLLMLLLGFAVSAFTGAQAFPITGRDTRFSLAAIFGSSLFVAGLLFALRSLASGKYWRRTFTNSSLGVLIVLTLYSFVIQDDYAKEWAHDRSVLEQIRTLTPDATPDTLLILHRQWAGEPPFLKTPRMPSINSQPHGVEISLRQLYDNKKGPWIFIVYSDQWKNFLAPQADGKLHWTKADVESSSARDLATPVEHVITLVEERNGQLHRDNIPIEIAGHQITLIATQQPSNWKAFAASPLAPKVFATP